MERNILDTFPNTKTVTAKDTVYLEYIETEYHMSLLISNRILPSLSFANRACKASFASSSLNLFQTLTLSSFDISIASLNAFLVRPLEPISFICLRYRD